METANGLQTSVVQLRALAQQILDRTSEFASAESLTGEEGFAEFDRTINDLPLLCSLAKEEYRYRRARDEYLDPSLFGEPAWDLLLDLFIQRAQGRLVSISSAAIAAGVPTTTALRWIGLLEQRNQIRRVDCPTDKRVSWIELTDEAFESVASSLRARTLARTSQSIFFR